MKQPEIVVLSKNGRAHTLRIVAPKKAKIALICHDGQNVFDEKSSSFGMSLNICKVLKKIHASKKVAIIAIDSTAARMRDYTPFVREGNCKYPDEGSGDGEKYMQYITDCVIPYIKKRFGYTKFAMMGSSAGANISLCYSTQGVSEVSAYGLFSTATFYAPEQFDKYLTEREFNNTNKFFVYVGGDEGDSEEERVDFMDDAFNLVKRLHKQNIQNIQFRFDRLAKHNEIAWAKYMPDFINYILAD